jgi:hypothetical protein
MVGTFHCKQATPLDASNPVEALQHFSLLKIMGKKIGQINFKSR